MTSLQARPLGKMVLMVIFLGAFFACSKGSSELVHDSEFSDNVQIGGELASGPTNVIEDSFRGESADAFASIQLKRTSKEQVIHSESFHISGKMVSKSRFGLTADQYLSITGNIKLPEILSGLETPVGCLTISVQDNDNTGIKSWLRISTTGITGEVLTKVTVPLLIGLENKVDVPIFPESLTLEHFPSNIEKIYEREVCFFLKEVETPAQSYEGEIIIQYLQETKEILASSTPPEEPEEDSDGSSEESDSGDSSEDSDGSSNEDDGGSGQEDGSGDDGSDSSDEEESENSDDGGSSDSTDGSENSDSDSEGETGGEEIPDEVLEALKGNLTKEDVVYLCQNFPKEQIDQEFFYPEREDCSWGKKRNKNMLGPYDNLWRKNYYLQAREVQSHTLDIPKFAVLCELEVTSHTDDNIQYDDFLVLTLNDYILMLSNHLLLREMPINNDFYFWDFAEIKGKYYEFHGDRFCFEGYQNCEFPGHDVPGPVDFFLDTDSLSPLASILEKEEELKFNVIATGDNDDEDCWHTDLYLNIRSNYVDFRDLFKNNI
ncbi:MAG: hypothetical protein AB8G05_27875 [Oligoflexales bacterium]